MASQAFVMKDQIRVAADAMVIPKSRDIDVAEKGLEPLEGSRTTESWSHGGQTEIIVGTIDFG